MVVVVIGVISSNYRYTRQSNYLDNLKLTSTCLYVMGFLIACLSTLYDDYMHMYNYRYNDCYDSTHYHQPFELIVIRIIIIIV